MKQANERAASLGSSLLLSGDLAEDTLAACINVEGKAQADSLAS